MDNLEDMNKFLEMYNLSRLNQEEIENTNRLITSNENVSKKTKKQTNKNPPNKQIQEELHRWIIPNIWEELTPILLKLFQRIAEEGMFLNSFYEASITWYQNQTKISQKRKWQANITDEYRLKNTQQNISKLNSTIY